MKPCQTLLQFAKSREKAYRITGRFTVERSKAVARIKQVAGFFRDKPTKAQLSAVRQCEQEIKSIIPDHRSRFTKMRESILSLIEMSHGLQNAN